eukprot:202187_1
MNKMKSELSKEIPSDSWLSTFYKWRNVVFMIGAVAIDSLLTWKVYLYSSEITFFVFGLCFTVVPLSILSIGLMCHERNDNMYLQGIPLLNILWILSLDNNKTKIMQIALSVLMSLPQYLLNDTFILSQRHLTFYNKLQLLGSYVVIMVSPLINFSMIMFDELKCEISYASDVEQKKKRQPVIVDAKLYCKVLMATSTVLPLILIELIHFFPVLLEYCFYEHITIMDLIANMILFNIPKIPISALTISIAMRHNKSNKNKRKKNAWCGWHFWMLCGLCLWSLITPLIVAIAVIKSEYTAHKTMLFLSICYILTSYGGMCAWLSLSVDPQYYGLGIWTKYCIVVILVLIFVNIVILIGADWYEYYRKGSNQTHHHLVLPYHMDQDEDEEDQHKVIQVANQIYNDHSVQKQEIKKLVNPMQ